MPRILVVGDSLPFGRPTSSEPIDVPESWPELLVRDDPELRLYLRARGANTSREVLLDIAQTRGYYSAQYFDRAIVQVGIVDATPRPMPLFASRVIGLGPTDWLGDRIERRINRSRTFYRLWGRPKVSVSRFESYLTGIVRNLAECSKEIVLIGLQPPSTSLQAKVGAYSVQPYNDVLRRVASSSTKAPTAAAILNLPLHKDGYHLSRRGHESLARFLQDFQVLDH